MERGDQGPIFAFLGTALGCFARAPAQGVRGPAGPFRTRQRHLAAAAAVLRCLGAGAPGLDRALARPLEPGEAGFDQKTLNRLYPRGRARGARGDPEAAGQGLGEEPGPNDPTSVTQQTQKDKVHLDGSGSGVKGHFDSMVQGNDWSDARGSRGTQVRPLMRG